MLSKSSRSLARRAVELVGCVLIAGACSHAQAQQPKKVPRIGYLAAVSKAADTPRLEAFRQGLRELGYVEGQNVIIEYRHEDRNFDQLPNLANELLDAKVDILVAVTTNAALAAKHTNTALPIFFMGVTDPVAAGLVETLGRPGGNTTGITNMAAVLTGKRLEFLKQIVPRTSRVAVLWDPRAPGSNPQWREGQVVARDLNLDLYSMEVGSVDRYEPAFKEAVAAKSTAVWVTLNPLANSNQKRIADLAIAHKLPSICARGDYAENGCLMAYGPGYSTEGRDAARYVDRILKGARPADIPVEQPTKFELLINQRTAKLIGVTIPDAVLLQADKVID